MKENSDENALGADVVDPESTTAGEATVVEVAPTVHQTATDAVEEVAVAPVETDAMVAASADSDSFVPADVVVPADVTVPADVVVPAEDVVPAEQIAVAPSQTVQAEVPAAPKPKGNRGFGVFFAVLATIVFAAVYAGLTFILGMLTGINAMNGTIVQFFTASIFYVPVIVFLIVTLLWALWANRAGWWSWVLGSLVIAVVTYFATIGVFILLNGGFGLAPSKAAALFAGYAALPALIVAAFTAREVAIWFGAAIAKRGRKVRERNYETWHAFELEEARKSADDGGAAAV